MTRIAAESVNYQERAREFQVGDRAFPYFGSKAEEAAGTVVAVYPAIGMAELQFPHGTLRYPVEELQLINRTRGTTDPMTPKTDTVPGGASTVPVSQGPERDPERAIIPPVEEKVLTKPVDPEAAQEEAVRIERVATAFFKRALYWAAADRRYQATKEECDSGNFLCPKCKESTLRKAVYKRREGQSERLLGCPSCLFLVKRDDILNHPEVA